MECLASLSDQCDRGRPVPPASPTCLALPVGAEYEPRHLAGARRAVRVAVRPSQSACRSLPLSSQPLPPARHGYRRKKLVRARPDHDAGQGLIILVRRPPSAGALRQVPGRRAVPDAAREPRRARPAVVNACRHTAPFPARAYPFTARAGGRALAVATQQARDWLVRVREPPAPPLAEQRAERHRGASSGRSTPRPTGTRVRSFDRPAARHRPGSRGAVRALVVCG